MTARPTRALRISRKNMTDGTSMCRLRRMTRMNGAPGMSWCSNT